MIAFVAFGFYYGSGLAGEEQTTFDCQIWKKYRGVTDLEGNKGRRHSMIKDLLDKHKLVGLSQDVIVSLLGLPDSISAEGRSLTTQQWHNENHTVCTVTYNMPVWVPLSDEGNKTARLSLDFENGSVVKQLLQEP
mgnify:CR=1 FL=1